MRDFFDESFTKSPSESVFHVYDKDKNTVVSKRSVHHGGQDDEEKFDDPWAAPILASDLDDLDNIDFGDSSTEFGDFSVCPEPKQLRDLVDEFAKVIEAEERFVQCYKQNYRSSDPDRIRKDLRDKGFLFRKAKMVTMLSSRALQDALIDEDSADCEQDFDDNLSVVMSVCTTYTSQTGMTDSGATSHTAARLMERLKDPSDHDTKLSKELSQLTPAELAKRYVELQEKMARKERKEKKKKKKERKEKKRKKKERKERERQLQEGEQAGPLQDEGTMGDSTTFLKTSSPLGSADQGDESPQAKAILRERDDYVQEYQQQTQARHDFRTSENKVLSLRRSTREEGTAQSTGHATVAVPEKAKKSLWKKLLNQGTSNSEV